MLYFYFLATLAFLFVGVYAQDCNRFNGTWTQPQVCKPTYNTPGVDAIDPTSGDALSAFFASLPTLPTKQCAQAYSSYYCGVNYPQCSADNTTVTPLCRTACQAVLESCEANATLFGGDFPLPTMDECRDLSTDAGCAVSSPPVLTSYYTDCGEVQLNATLFGATSETNIMCRPDYTVPTINITAGYPRAQQVFNTFMLISQRLSQDDKIITDEWYPCVKAFSNFFCSKAFPPCNENEALPLKSVCSSVCHKIITDCGNYTENFAIAGVTPLPTFTECDALPSTNCFVPANNSWVGFYFGNHDPPVPLEPTQPSTTGRKPNQESEEVTYPPGGAATGGGIGAGVLIGLLLVIGLVMLIMKKQDSR